MVEKLYITAPPSRAWARLATVYGVGSLAAFWMIERVAGFWV